MENKDKVNTSYENHNKIKGCRSDCGKNPDVNDKIIIITEDLLREIGISDKDYF